MSDKIKELFTIQYWGQKVYKPETVSDPMEVNSGDMGSGYLLLRSVEQLTYEEYLTLAKLSTGYTGIILLKEIVRGGVIFSQVYNCKRLLFRFKDFQFYTHSAAGYELGYSKNNHKTIDYMRSIGILLPITYLENNKPITIQPEEILKRGWAKYQGICKISTC